jgi:ribonuclease-3
MANSFSQENWQLLETIVGFTLTDEDKLIIFKAFIHPSIDGKPGHNYEQLEFLGDSLISFITSNFLFIKFPTKKEGELSKLRSWLVSRNRLNEIGKKLMLDQWVIHKQELDKFEQARNTSGNVLEALVGAIFLCKGQKIAQEFIHHHILSDEIDDKGFKYMDPKSYLQEWVQRQKKKLQYVHLDEAVANAKSYKVECYIDNKLISSASGYNKKTAEWTVAQKVIEVLGI